MKNMLKKYWPHLLVLAVPFVFIAVMWPQIPARVATRFNAEGKPNGWMTKTIGVLLLPCITCSLHAFVLVWFRLDPKMKKSDPETREHVAEVVRKVMLATEMLLSASCIAIVWTACHPGSLIVMDVIGYGVPLLLLVLGNYLGKLRPNWTVGIRCGWTLESPAVWTLTHRFGGRLLFIIALLLLAAKPVTALARYHVWLVLASLLLWAAVTYLYAFLSWRGETHPAQSVKQ